MDFSMQKAGLEARRFRVEVVQQPSPKPGTWAHSLVNIFDGDAQIGSYLRNYPRFGEQTFEPFELVGTWYALYSPQYTATRVMRLPECLDLGGEEPHSHGFCPVELFVPRYRKVAFTERGLNQQHTTWGVESNGEEKAFNGPFGNRYEYTLGPWLSLDSGFVAGCIWGDDTSWKLEVIDLSRAAEGVIERSARFGHVELGKMPWAEAVRIELSAPDGEVRIDIVRQERRFLRTGKLIDPYDE
jgi:hypothetical protein